MARPNPDNLPRPDRVEHVPEVVISKRPVNGVLDRLSAKHVASFNNPKLKPCCQNVMEHEAQFEKSNPGLSGPDKVVFTCKCGCKHIRMAVGGAATNTE